MSNVQTIEEKGRQRVKYWKQDWCAFAREALGVSLDAEQEAILSSVQHNPMTSVASGTARGKDFVAAVSAICFMYLTPKWDKNKDLIANTKVALTAPTDRQVVNIMMPEISRLYNRAKKKGIQLPGRLLAYGIRTSSEEWFLTGFKASEHDHEAWSGFHAVNTMFVVTEASGISDDTFGAIEGNLQGNSRILIVFNPNQTVGYAAKSQKGERWSKFRLNSLTAPNVIEKRQVIPGQVDYNWVIDKLENWCEKIPLGQTIDIAQDDFQFEGQWYRPQDIFRIKVLGKFPKTGKDALIPEQWIEAAQERWVRYHKTIRVDPYPKPLRLGVDVAGMGRDSTVFAHRHGNIGKAFTKSNSGGEADHMEVAGRIVHILRNDAKATAYIDTIGEGAGVYSRTSELGYESRALSCKNSEAATDDSGEPLTDITGQYTFANMRAYLGWAVRDWLNPKNYPENTPDIYMPMLPPGGGFLEEATEIRWSFRSDGKIKLEDKDDVIDRLKRSPDEFDAMANTFYPFEPTSTVQDLSGYF